MKTLTGALVAVALSVAVCDAFAIDRGVGCIEYMGFCMASYEDMQEIGLSILSETAVPTATGNTSVLLGLGYCTVSEDGAGGRGDCWAMEFGLKYYVSEWISVSFTGSHREYHLAGSKDTDMSGLTVGTKYRFYSSFNRVSPYACGDASVQFGDQPMTAAGFTALTLAGRLGCDFLLSETTAVNIEAGVSESEKLSGDSEFADGWLLSMGVRYYWD